MAQLPENSPGLVRVSRDGELPLSANQWLIYAYPLRFPDAPAHYWHLPGTFRITGNLDPGVFLDFFDGFVRRHEPFRTLFVEPLPGHPRQRIVPPGPLTVPFIDLRDLDPAQRAGETYRLLRETLVKPFDWAVAPPWRALLLQLDTCEYRFLVATHHILADARSQAILFQDLGIFYTALLQGLPPQYPHLDLQYVDFAVWQQRRLAAGELDDQIEHWVRQSTPPYALLDIPTDFPRTAGAGYAGRVARFLLPADEVRQYEAYAQRAGVTLFSVVFAGLLLLLHQRTRQTDIAVGLPVAGRTREEWKNMIGLFAIQLPFRIDVADDPSFAELVQRVRRTSRQTLANQDAPLMEAVQRLVKRGHPVPPPLTQVIFIYQNAVVPRLELPDLTFELDPDWELLELARAELLWQFFETPAGLAGVLEYRTDLYLPATIEQLLADYRDLLGEAVSRPERKISTCEVSAASRT